MAQKSAMSQSQLTGAISAKDGSRWKADAMKSMTVLQFYGFAWSVRNEDENQP
jgi:hypothetical protein